MARDSLGLQRRSDERKTKWLGESDGERQQASPAER